MGESTHASYATPVIAGNQIPAITNLEHLSELQRLNLSKNGITDLINLNAKLGNIKELILVENRLTSLLGEFRLFFFPLVSDFLCRYVNVFARLKLSNALM